jgi:hypothetical protein
MLTIDNLPKHVWSSEAIQTISGSSCLSFEIAPASLNREDLSRFFVVAWAIHPNLIPDEVGCVVPEPEEEQVVGVRPLFLREDEIIHSKQDTLQFRPFMRSMTSPSPIDPPTREVQLE